MQNNLNDVITFFYRCRERVNKYIESKDPEETLDVDADFRKIHFCYQYFKHLLKQASNSRPTSMQAIEFGGNQQVVVPKNVSNCS